MSPALNLNPDAVPVYECDIEGWPVGELGVAIANGGILLRRGLSEAERSRAVDWARWRLGQLQRH